MERPEKIDPSTYIMPYINSCYDNSLFCDLIITSADKKCVACHKIVLCSLSKKLHDICTDDDQIGSETYLHLQDFPHKDVKDTIDKIYANTMQEEVEFENSEVLTVLGIQGTCNKQRVKKEKPDLPTNDVSDGLDMGDFVKSELACDLMDEGEDWDENYDEFSTNQQLESLDVIEYHDYGGTRHEFWEENFVKVILKVSSFIQELCLVSF